MSKENRKQTFLGGAAVLALATAVVKIIGLFYKVPIQHTIGEDGYSYFSAAYQIYDVLLMIATAGLPVAMSRMISEAGALDNDRQINKIFSVAKKVFLIIGVSGTLLMAVGCRIWAVVLGQPNAWFSILCLSPAVLFICITSANRGFFQGQGNMKPTSVSQVLEALCKLIFGLGLAVFIMWLFRQNGLVEGPADALTEAQKNDLSIAHSWAAGGAILGVSIGCVVAAFYLTRKVRKTAVPEGALRGEEKSGRQTAKELMKIALPITIGAAGLQTITLLDSVVYMWRLKDAAGFSQLDADHLKGIYTFCQTIFNLPCAFVTPIVVSAIPALTERITKKDRTGERSIMESAIRVMALIAFPCAIGLAVLSGPIYRLLADYTEQSLLTAEPVLSLLGVCVMFNSTVLVTNGIMQSHGDVTTPVIHMLIGGVIKVVINFFLVGNPAINIIGVPIGTLICYIIIASLNLFAMARKNYPINLLRTMFKPLVAALLMGGAAYGVRLLLDGRGLSNTIVTAGSIVAAGVVYVILVLVLRIITKEDCALLPKGEKIAKILKIR